MHMLIKFPVSISITILGAIFCFFFFCWGAKDDEDGGSDDMEAAKRILRHSVNKNN
jgi:hypothetical protein